MKTFIILCLIALPCFAGEVRMYHDLNMNGKIITNVAIPKANNNAVNFQYVINQLASLIYEKTNLTVAVPARTYGGYTGSYTPIAGEDLNPNMLWGVPWETNLRFNVDVKTGSNVLDNLTLLMWTKDANACGASNFYQAIDFCTNLVWGGYSDWRMPNVRELESLVDISKINPALPDGHPFTNVQNNKYWTCSENSWTVAMNQGSLENTNGGNQPSDNNYIWPVRGGQRGN